MLSIIVAMSNNNVIGKNNELIWHLPADLKRFKELTTGHTIIMGKNTFESLGRVLPNRFHVVFAKEDELQVENENVKLVDDISKIEDLIKSDEENFIIGGGMIYKLLLPFANKMYITKINQDFEGDTYFPEFDEKEWKVVERQKGIRDEKNDYDYEFVTYERES